MGRVDEAIASFRNSTLIDPEYANGHINIGNIMNELGRYDESQVHLEKALRLKPNSPEVHNNLGLMFHEGKKQLEAAASSFQRALSIRPLNYPTTHPSSMGRLRIPMVMLASQSIPYTAWHHLP